jgi:hypothetical protein
MLLDALREIERRVAGISSERVEYRNLLQLLKGHIDRAIQSIPAAGMEETREWRWHVRANRLLDAARQLTDRFPGGSAEVDRAGPTSFGQIEGLLQTANHADYARERLDVLREQAYRVLSTDAYRMVWRALDTVKKAIPAAKSIYRLLGAEDLLQVRYPDSAHDFPPPTRKEAYELIDKVLKHTPARDLP